MSIPSLKLYDSATVLHVKQPDYDGTILLEVVYTEVTDDVQETEARPNRDVGYAPRAQAETSAPVVQIPPSSAAKPPVRR